MDDKVENKISEITGRIIASAQAVYGEMGPGFEEAVYHRALAFELTANEMEFGREEWIEVNYRGQKVGRKKLDFVVEGVMVEIETKVRLKNVDVAKALSSLKASGYEAGLLLNFGGKNLEIKHLTHALNG